MFLVAVFACIQTVSLLFTRLQEQHSKLSQDGLILVLPA